MMDSGPMRRLSLEEEKNQQVFFDQNIVTSPISPRNLRLMEDDRNCRVRRWSLEESRAVQQNPSVPGRKYSVQMPISSMQQAVQGSNNVQSLVQTGSNMQPMVQNGSNMQQMVQNGSNMQQMVQNGSNMQPMVQNGSNMQPMVQTCTSMQQGSNLHQVVQTVNMPSGVQSVCQVQPMQMLQPPRYRSGSFDPKLAEQTMVQSQVQFSEPLSRPIEPNQWQQEDRTPRFQYQQNYEPVYQVVRTQYQPYQSAQQDQSTLQQVYPSQSLQTGYNSIPVQSYPSHGDQSSLVYQTQSFSTGYSPMPAGQPYQTQSLSGQVLQPVLDDHLHKPLQAVQPMQFNVQDMTYSVQQAPGQHVLQLIETQPVTSHSDPTPSAVVKQPSNQLEVNINPNPEEPVRVRKVSFQDEAIEEITEDEPYVGLRRLRPNKQSKSVDAADESLGPKPNKGILQRKSRSKSESCMPAGRVRRNSMCPMTAYNLRGSSTVAIDNKIEQAMDLVKSHLMFAVREEVEVLKEQIAELIERNNQLEYENGILRAAASPETLAKLAQPRQPPTSSSS